jgi:hypothetical protein
MEMRRFTDARAMESIRLFRNLDVDDLPTTAFPPGFQENLDRTASFMRAQWLSQCGCCAAIFCRSRSSSP